MRIDLRELQKAVESLAKESQDLTLILRQENNATNLSMFTSNGDQIKIELFDVSLNIPAKLSRTVKL